MERCNKKIRTDKQPRRHLAEEIIEEILSRLQVKSLLRFQLVSKSWARLISSERFIKAHLQNSRENADLANHRVIYDYLGDLVFPSRREYGDIGELKQYSVHSLMNDPVPDSSGMEHLMDVGVVGCCNGLVCVRDPPKRSFYLWNPATRIWIELPKLERVDFIKRTGFGWDESSGAYKVFVFLYDTDVEVGFDRCIVYSSNTNKWEERVYTNFYWGSSCVREDGVLVNGKLHWHGYGGEEGEEVVIVSVDLKSEEIGSMEHPVEEGRDLFDDIHSVSLGVVGGCLCAVQHGGNHVGNELEVWVMKEYGVKESWFRAMAVDLEDFLGPYIMFSPFRLKPFGGIANVLGEGPEGEILISYESYFLVYNPSKDTITMVSRLSLNEIKPAGARPHIYFETLVSPGPNATFKNRLGPNATLKNRFLSFIYFCLGRLL